MLLNIHVLLTVTVLKHISNFNYNLNMKFKQSLKLEEKTQMSQLSTSWSKFGLLEEDGSQLQ